MLFVRKREALVADHADLGLGPARRRPCLRCAVLSRRGKVLLAECANLQGLLGPDVVKSGAVNPAVEYEGLVRDAVAAQDPAAGAAVRLLVHEPEAALAADCALVGLLPFRIGSGHVCCRRLLRPRNFRERLPPSSRSRGSCCWRRGPSRIPGPSRRWGRCWEEFAGHRVAQGRRRRRRRGRSRSRSCVTGAARPVAHCLAQHEQVAFPQLARRVRPHDAGKDLVQRCGRTQSTVSDRDGIARAVWATQPCRPSGSAKASSGPWPQACPGTSARGSRRQRLSAGSW